MSRTKIRWAIRLIVLAALIPIGFLSVRWGSGNFGAVIPGKVFRSAQPSPSSLPGTIRSNGIKTVLNLRGANPEQDWYLRESAATLSAGATQVDFPMSSDQWLSREQARVLLQLLDSCEYPIMIHCEWGAERTGLVSAIRRLLEEGSTLADGRREFSTYYLFLPVKDGKVMRGHLDLYEKWLADRGSQHSPSMLRTWLTNEYSPGSPSREHWECNPYPMKVVTKPRVPAVITWGANPCRVTR